MRAEISRVVDGFIGNPFDLRAKLRADLSAVVDRLDVKAEVSALVDAGEVENAKYLLLAVGHAQACRHPDDPERALPSRLLTAELWRALPRDRGEYLRIVMGAGRCYRALSGVLGESDRMNRVRHDTWAACFGDSLRNALNLERVIRDHDVLLFGETGTGKEAIARAIQLATPGGPDGAPAPMAAINAAAVPDTLVESALFGHVKGAFTGAQETRIGRIRKASGGAFFLDEVGDLPMTTQVKLLRVMETNEVFPLGSDSAETVDVRYIAATHKELEEMVERNEFRRDLFQRMAGNVIRMPPLRDRPEDMIEIGTAFVDEHLRGARPEQAERIHEWLHSEEAVSYAWPGNVRELQNALRNLMLGLDPGIAKPARRPGAVDPSLPADIRDCEAKMDAVSDWYLRRVLDHCEGNFTQAAKILDIDRSTVRRRMKALSS